MAIRNYEIKPLFAVPFLRADIGHAVSSEQIAYIKKLKMVQNPSNLISENLYIFEEPELKSIKDAVQEVLDIYATEVMGVEQKLYVTQSWSLINLPRLGMHGHNHPNSLVSGSFYYCDLPTPVSSMIFQRHNSYQQLELDPSTAKRNLFNSPVNIVVPKRNEVILFSSSIFHSVETNNSDRPRYSIAFNCFVKGKFGNYRDVTELQL